MNGECYFCHGLVSAVESDHLLLDEHANHAVYLHEQCAEGHNLIEETAGPAGGIEVTCPECGAAERREGAELP